MPYIDSTGREFLDPKIPDSAGWSAGELVYVLSRLVYKWLPPSNTFRFINLCIAMGVLVCTTLEFYRRVVAPYEDKKINENGDVYK